MRGGQAARARVWVVMGFLLIGCAGAPRTVKDFNTAVRLIDQQRYGKAEELLWKLVRYSPDDHAAWNQLGLIAFRDRRWSEAERCFRRATSLAPTHLVYRRNLALALAEQNELGLAEGILEQLAKADPENVVYRTDLARVFWLLGDRDRARAELSKARELAPEDRTIQLLTHTWSRSPEASK